MWQTALIYVKARNEMLMIGGQGLHGSLGILSYSFKKQVWNLEHNSLGCWWCHSVVSEKHNVAVIVGAARKTKMFVLN